MDAVAIIGVTGSCGKTTTKDLIAHALSSRLHGAKSTGSSNCGPDVAADILRIAPTDDFYVQELGAWGPGTLDAGLDLLRPGIGVVTNFRNDHYSAFRGPRGAQAEKGKLIRALPPDGTAVLNWDDPLVRELVGDTRARVVSVGRHRQAAVRADDVASRWPQTLSFRVRCSSMERHVRTRLLGTHLLGSVLCAIGVGIAMGLTLTECVDALETAAPTPRRMSVALHPDGVTFVRDDFKAPADGVPDALRFLRDADVGRRIAVLGRISDYPGRSRAAYSDTARQALAAADLVIFVGDRAADLWGECGPDDPVPDGVRAPSSNGSRARMAVFRTVERAARFIRADLRSGDLVLLKASGTSDHLERIALDRFFPVSCWLEHCGRVVCCDDCDLVRH